MTDKECDAEVKATAALLSDQELQILCLRIRDNLEGDMPVVVRTLTTPSASYEPPEPAEGEPAASQVDPRETLGHWLRYSGSSKEFFRKLDSVLEIMSRCCRKRGISMRV